MRSRTVDYLRENGRIESCDGLSYTCRFTLGVWHSLFSMRLFMLGQSVCVRVVGCRLRSGETICLKDWDDVYSGHTYLIVLLLSHVQHSWESFRLHVLWRDWNVTREDITQVLWFHVKGNKNLRLDVDVQGFFSLIQSFGLLETILIQEKN